MLLHSIAFYSSSTRRLSFFHFLIDFHLHRIICGRHEITESVPTVEELEKFSETELRDKLFAIAVPIVPRDIKKAISRNELANVLHKALLDKKIILDSLEVATAEYGRRQPNRRFRNFPDPVNETGSVDYENIGRFGSQSEVRNTIPSLHRLNYNQLQPIHPSIGQGKMTLSVIFLVAFLSNCISFVYRIFQKHFLR